MSYVFNPFTGNFDQTSSTSPGGSDTQIQFNDGGSFGGDAGLTYNKTTGKLTVGGKTLTASAPIDFSQTWNNAGVTFTGLKFNVTDTASGASSLLMDLQVGGISRISVGKGSTGGFQASDVWFRVNNYSGQAVMGWKGGGNGQMNISGPLYYSDLNFSSNVYWGFGYASISLSKDIELGWSNSANSVASIDLKLVRDSANVLAQRNSTNAQESRIYATYTNATNYQRCGIKTGKTTLSNVTGASVTATGLIPAGALLIGVTSRVNTTCTTASGYTVGTAGDPDLWGVASTVSAGTATGSANFTAAGASGLFTAATDVIVTATGGNFDGTGVIELAVHYLLTEAD